MKGSTVSLIGGVLAIVAGVFALIFPLPVGLAITTFAGVAFLVTGALGLFAAFSDKTMARRGWVALVSALQLVLGVLVLADPLVGLVSLTMVAGVMFLLSGIVRLYLAWHTRGTLAFWPMLLTGILSAGLGLYTLFYPLAASAVLLGTLLAIELLSVGAALIAMGMTLRKFK